MNTNALCYVYMYLDGDNVPFYIGKGTSYRYSPGLHKTQNNKHLWNKIRKTGKKLKIIFLHLNIESQEAFKWETYWINYIGRKDLGNGSLLNLTNGGEGVGLGNKHRLGRKHSAETIEKIRESNRLAKIGNILQDSHKQNISESMKKYWDDLPKEKRTRPKFSEERKKKHSEACRLYWEKRKEVV